MIPILSNRLVALFLSLFIGMLLPLAFAPYEFRFIAFLVPAFLFLLWRNLPEKSIYLSGLLFQTGFFAVGVHWVYYSIHLFGNAVAPLALFVTALFVIGLALICSLSGWLYVHFAKGRSLFVAALMFVAVWTLMEWVRGWLFGGFPWLIIGYSQVDTWFGAMAPIIGVYGIGFFVVLSSVLIVTLLTGRSNRERIYSIASLCVVAMLVVTASNLNWAQDKSESLRIRMVQGNVKQQVKFDRDALATTLDLYAELSVQGEGDKPDVIIWPETAIPTLFQRVESYLQPFVDSMDAQGISILSGGFRREDEDQVYNAFRELTGEKQTYLKSHLVPFGEFMPFRFILDFLAKYIEIPMSDLSAGELGQQPIAVSGEKFGISICFEDVFGEEMRLQLPDATILVNVSNDTWFGDSAAPFQHQEIAAMRAREFSRPLVRVTNTGISSFISPDGKVLDSISQFEQGVLEQDVMPRSGRTPYVVVGNYPAISLFLMIFIGVGLTRKKVHASTGITDHS